jgi:hypothetical protein
MPRDACLSPLEVQKVQTKHASWVFIIHQEKLTEQPEKAFHFLA